MYPLPRKLQPVRHYSPGNNRNDRLAPGEHYTPSGLPFDGLINAAIRLIRAASNDGNPDCPVSKRLRHTNYVRLEIWRLGTSGWTFPARALDGRRQVSAEPDVMAAAHGKHANDTPPEYYSPGNILRGRFHRSQAGAVLLPAHHATAQLIAKSTALLELK